MTNKSATKDPIAKLDAVLLQRMHQLMTRARCLEERLIKMNKTGEGYFWLGGPGEEAFNIPLGLLIKKGHGVQYDFLHFHYRSAGIILALGGNPIEPMRQMRSVATDPHSKGRNFVNHYAIPEWNVTPISPIIEAQYSTAIGTAIAQRRVDTDAITIVNGGDAGTAEGDFHSCLVWANRPVLALPLLIIVVNNGYGISTVGHEQHGEREISDWGRVFDMPSKTIDGNDPIASYFAISEAMAYCRKERKPYLLEAKVSRLYGHSSSSGANRVAELDCIAEFEKRLTELGIVSQASLDAVWQAARDEVDAAHNIVKQEPFPAPESIWENVFAEPVPSSYPKKGGS